MRISNKRGGELNVMNLVLIALLISAVYMDMIQTRISNRLIVLGLVSGCFFRFMTEGSKGIFFCFVNISIPVILLYLLFQMRALGAGDIKLFSMIGTFISTQQLLKLMGLAFLVGALFGIVKIMYRFIFLKTEKGALTKIHFSPSILIAYVMIIWR